MDRALHVAEADALFAAHRDRVFRYLCRFVGHGETARDLTQEVFLRVSRGPVPDVSDELRRAWVFRIARNLALNHLRDGRRRGTPVELTEAPHPATQELAASLREALATLGHTDRDVFLLRETAGLSYDEIAEACDLSADGVRSRLHRARQHLRAALAPALDRTQQVRGVRMTHD
jgi:RNA polymerase sigma-70 factor (ECF subfamily)